MVANVIDNAAVHPVPKFVVHESPVWRERSTTVIRAVVPDPPEGETWYEQLWARRLEDHRYELCCIPFTTYEYALGDIVEVGSTADSQFMVRGICAHSGRNVLRAWLAGAPRETWDEIHEELRNRSILFEFRQPALVAIDVADDRVRKEVESALQRFSQSGEIEYERGSQGYGPPSHR